MFRSWFRGTLRRAAAKGAREDLKQFVESLRRLSNVQIGAAVAAAAIVRVALRENGVLSNELLRVTRDPMQVTTQLSIAQLVRRYQAEQRYREATGALIWLHSLRALNFPEARLLGREMWGELRRGQTHALNLLRDTGVSPLSNEAFECARVPEDPGFGRWRVNHRCQHRPNIISAANCNAVHRDNEFATSNQNP